MSIKVMSWVWQHSQLGGPTLLLLLAIADFANDAGIAFPAVATLAAKIRMSERNTQYLLKKLEESGELIIEKNAGPKGCNLFRVQSLQGADFAGVQPVVKGGATGGKKGVQAFAPEPSLNHQEPSIESHSDEIAKQKNKKPKQKRESETLKAFIERCKTERVKTVPADDPIFGYAEKVGLSEQMLALAWAAFKSQYLPSMKRQKDWRAHFRNAVRGNWFKLWFIAENGSATLTTAGRQAQLEQEADAMEMAA